MKFGMLMLCLVKQGLPLDAHCCHMGTAAAMKHPVPDLVKPSFVICDILAL